MLHSKVLLGLLAFLGLSTSLKAQDYAISTNIPSLLLGNINIEPSMRLSPNLSLQLGISARPKSFGLPLPTGIIHWIYNGHRTGFSERMSWGTVKHVEHFSFAPSLRLWYKGVYNRGMFLGIHGLGMVYRYGSDSKDFNYSQGLLIGGGLSVGYSHELAPHWNLEAEGGISGAWTKYDLRVQDGALKQADKSRLLVLPSRLALRLVYVF